MWLVAQSMLKVTKTRKVLLNALSLYIPDHRAATRTQAQKSFKSSSQTGKNKAAPQL